MTESKHLIVYVAAPPTDAPALAQMLVERRLAACVNIVPAVQSVYVWNGALCQEQEALLVIKSRAELFAALRQAVIEQHPYELPEVIAVAVEQGHGPYLAWIDANTDPP